MKLIVVFLITVSLKSVFAGPSCLSQLALLSRTDALIAYLNILFEQRTLNAAHLSSLISALEKGQVINPFTKTQGATESRALVHGEELSRFVEGPLDTTRLLKWATDLQLARETDHVKRKTVRTDTTIAFESIVFHPIDPTKFENQLVKEIQNPLDPPGKKTLVVEATDLTHPFEMMSTPVTQKQWVDLMGGNPSYFSQEGAFQTRIDGKDVRMLPDNPVELVNWWAALEFANRMSEKAGLKPAYDLSRIRMKSESDVKFGRLIPESGELVINAPEGNIYKAQGYRLPTDREIDFMLRHAVHSYGASLGEYTWNRSNSGETTHPVSQFAPVLVEGKPFYDLLGNVGEWTTDSANIRPNIPAEHFLQGRIYRGGSFLNDPSEIFPARLFLAPWRQDATIGFRLVRTLK